MFSTEAAFCFLETGGTLFSIYGQDVANPQVCVAFMFVTDNEKEDTWRLFLQFVADVVAADWTQVTLITDKRREMQRMVDEYLRGIRNVFAYTTRCRTSLRIPTRRQGVHLSRR